MNILHKVEGFLYRIKIHFLWYKLMCLLNKPTMYGSRCIICQVLIDEHNRGRK